MRKGTVRNQIVDTASRLFYKQGYNATGINQIIDEAGVAKASLYQHFHSKEDLLAAYLTEKGIETNAALKAVADQHKNPKEKVLAIFDFLDKLTNQNDYYGCNFLNIASELPVDSTRLRNLIRKQKDDVRALFGEILKPVKKEKLADELYMLFDGALITNKVHGSGWPVQTARRIAEKII
ncbi:MAG: TetR/AcrR family transcriptional regulator [Bacteroidetes bacterium]|jgi:AcrR family transcriptional regulator|nr:TetR/AcrR family transcriptional regulator [Bacteroidota bacterium]